MSINDYLHLVDIGVVDNLGMGITISVHADFDTENDCLIPP